MYSTNCTSHSILFEYPLHEKEYWECTFETPHFIIKVFYIPCRSCLQPFILLAKFIFPCILLALFTRFLHLNLSQTSTFLSRMCSLLKLAFLSKQHKYLAYVLGSNWSILQVTKNYPFWKIRGCLPIFMVNTGEGSSNSHRKQLLRIL